MEAPTVPKRFPAPTRSDSPFSAKRYTAPLQIVPDPRLKLSSKTISRSNSICSSRFATRLTETDDTIIQIRDLRDQINAVNKRLKNDPREKAFADAGKALDKKMTEVEEALIQTKAKSGQDVLNFPVRLNNHIAASAEWSKAPTAPPTAQSYEVFDMLSKQLDEQLTKWKAIVSTDVASYNNLVKQQDVPMLLLANPEAGK